MANQAPQVSGLTAKRKMSPRRGNGRNLDASLVQGRFPKGNADGYVQVDLHAGLPELAQRLR
eukprot:4443524-Pyramimonas_sp.AAC.1